MDKSVKLLDKQKIFLLSSLMFIIIAQLNINLIINGFKISMAIILLPIFTFILEDFQVFPVTLLSAPGVFIVRCALEWLSGGKIMEAAVSYAPEMLFFLLFGGMFAVYTRFVDFTSYRLIYFSPLILIDFLSNMGEMLLRLGGNAFSGNIISSLLIVALGRTLIAVVILGAFDYYGLFMLKKDDRERYKKLLLLISQLKSEVIWMNKNTFRIEDTMAISYKLYSDLNQIGEEAAAQQALTVAKDVHEIKKEYFLIMSGISSALELDMEETGMYSKNIFQILQDSAISEAKSLGKEIIVTVNCERNFYTDQHYFLMSIFRNLFTNAVEAAGENLCKLSLSQQEESENFIFLVEDNCGGIDADYMANVFLPGFSTKISYETGIVSRGLGLCLVRDIVEEQLGGKISVTSTGAGTQFLVSIPQKNLCH